MIYTGVTATDSHQQESERVRIEMEINGDAAVGRIGTAFGSVYLEPGELRFFMDDFTATLTQVSADAWATWRISMKYRDFSCHAFTAKEFYFVVSGNEAFLSEQAHERRVMMWKG